MTTILTVGPDDLAQRTRDLILQLDGLVAKHVSSQDVLWTLRQEQFDLIILAHGTTTETDSEIVAMADGHTRIIRLGELTLPEDLLDRIHRTLETGNVIQVNRHA